MTSSVTFFMALSSQTQIPGKGGGVTNLECPWGGEFAIYPGIGISHWNDLEELLDLSHVSIFPSLEDLAKSIGGMIIYIKYNTLTLS